MFGSSGFGNGFFGGPPLPTGTLIIVPPSGPVTPSTPQPNLSNIPSVPAINYIDSRKVYSTKSKYSFLLYIAGKLVADLTPLAQNKHFVLTRNDTDQIDFMLNLDALEDLARKLNLNTQDMMQAGISEIRVLRYGVVLTAGYLSYWDAELAVDRQIPCKFRGWMDLLNYRIVTTAYINKTALQIIQDLINTTQLLNYGNLNLTWGAVPTVDNTNLYPSKTYTNKTIYDIIQELTADSGGIDIEFTWDKKINIWYPGMGIIRQDVVFSYPGNIKDLKVSNDATQQINSVVARGNGSGANQLIKTADDFVSQAKYGLKQGIVDFPDIADGTQLQNLANSQLKLFSIPLILHDVQIDGLQEPQVGAYHLGDQIRISVTKLLKLYAGVNDFFKVDKIDVTIGKDEEEDVSVSTNKPV